MYRLKGVMPKKPIKKDTETYTQNRFEFDYNAAKKGLTEFVEVPIAKTSSTATVWDVLLKATRAERLLSDIDKRDIWEGLAKIVAKFENTQMISTLTSGSTAHAAEAAWDSESATSATIVNDLNELVPIIQEYSDAPLALIGPTTAIAKLYKSNDYGNSPAKLLSPKIDTIISSSLITTKVAFLVPKDPTIAFTGVAEEADQHMWNPDPKTTVLGFTEAVMPFVAESSAVYRLTGVLS
jgi:hypothetical protein